MNRACGRPLNELEITAAAAARPFLRYKNWDSNSAHSALLLLTHFRRFLRGFKVKRQMSA